MLFRPKRLYSFFLAGLVILISISLGSALASGMSVSSPNIDAFSRIPTANDLKPAACSSIFLSNIIRGSGTINGTSGNDLILGSSADDIINGNGGNDCIVAGAGNDTIDGGDGTDICIEGSGTNTTVNCE